VQNTKVKRLTELAFIFIPLSFVASIFGMNVDVLKDNQAPWWTVIVGSLVTFAFIGFLFGSIAAVSEVKSRRQRLKRKTRQEVDEGLRLQTMARGEEQKLRSTGVKSGATDSATGARESESTSIRSTSSIRGLASSSRESLVLEV
jgi:hypothetical protein